MQIMQSRGVGRRLLAALSGEAGVLQQQTGVSQGDAAAIAAAIANANSIVSEAANPADVETVSYLVQAKVRIQTRGLQSHPGRLLMPAQCTCCWRSRRCQEVCQGRYAA